MPDSAEHPDLGPQSIPERLGRYRLIKKIGEGGMGLVYLAHDQDLGRDVALKLLPPELALSDDLLERFRREAATLSRLDHPAIVAIHEFGEDQGLHYFVMPLIEGISLKDWVRLLERRRLAAAGATGEGSGTAATGGAGDKSADSARPTDPSRDLGRILEVFETAADALAHAHRHGVIHRDVKPSNILIDREGRPHLLDFGLAKIVGEATRTSAGSFMGTLPYMAPEQVAESALPLDARTDVYALGVTLFECLCGRRPFTAGTADALALQILMKQAPSPREFAPDLSRDLATIVLKCLEKDPGRRYADARELARDLRRFREHREIEARPVGRMGRTLRWAETHRGLALFGLITTLAFLILGSLATVNYISTRNEQKRFKIYGKHVDRARELEAERESKKTALALQRDALLEIEKTVEPQLPPSHAAKQELYRARAEVRRLEVAVARLEGEIEYELQRSREAVEPILLEGRERGEILQRIHAEALARDDLVTAARTARFLEDAGINAETSARGHLTVSTRPAGAVVTVHPIREDIDGVRRPDISAGRDLGISPIAKVELEAGLWEVTLRKAGFEALVFPVLIEHGEHWGDASWHGGLFADRDWTLELCARGEIDGERWCQVPAGPYQASRDGDVAVVPRLEWRWVDEFFIARRECSFGAYEPFLARREILQETIKTATEQNCFLWLPRIYDWLGVFKLMSDGRLADGEATADQPARPYSPDFALCGLSFTEFDTFVAWMAEAEKAPISLPTADQWQKAARGVDGRSFPWGDRFDWAFTSGRYSVGGTGPEAWEFHPRKTGLFQIDRSPYGALDMAGNAAEWCADAPPGDSYGDQRWVLGGSFGWAQPALFTTWPVRSYPYGHVDFQFGIRLARTRR